MAAAPSEDADLICSRFIRPIAHKCPKKLTFEKTSGVLLVHREEHTGGLSVAHRKESVRAGDCGDLPELGEGELGSPHLTLAAETVRADQLEPVKQRKRQRVSDLSVLKWEQQRRHRALLLLRHHPCV